jgi:uncharacterized protein
MRPSFPAVMERAGSSAPAGAPQPSSASLRRGLLAAGRVLLLLGLVYLGFAVMLTALQARMLYFPSREIVATPAQVGMEYEELRLVAGDGVGLQAWYVPSPEAQGHVLFLHGNAGNLSHRLQSLRDFHDMGYAVLILSYRGYGTSEGRPSEEGTYRDAQAAWRHLVEERGISPDRIALFGRSLGGAVAARQAARARPGALILESTFTSVPDLAADLYPFLPVRLLSRFRYDTAGLMPSIAAPVLVVHSRGDEIVGFAHGETLFSRARGPREFLELEGGHNDGFARTGERYRTALRDFLDRHLGGG